jgi:ABC-type Fe3+-hydroxamate transport system substrate-binding protein
MRSASRGLTVIAIVGALLGTSACTGGSDEPSDQVSASAAGVIAPVIVQLVDQDGRTVSVGLDNVVDLVAVDPTVWSAEIEDPSIAEYVPGGSRGGASFNPGLQPLAVGSTTVALTNRSDDSTVVFTLEVVAGP